MKIVLAQINSKIGDLAANEAKHAAAITRASAEGAGLVVFPEMSLLGYPPRDLVERHGVADACLAACERLASVVPASMLALEHSAEEPRQQRAAEIDREEERNPPPWRFSRHR